MIPAEQKNELQNIRSLKSKQRKNALKEFCATHNYTEKQGTYMLFYYTKVNLVPNSPTMTMNTINIPFKDVKIDSVSKMLTITF